MKRISPSPEDWSMTQTGLEESVGIGDGIHDLDCGGAVAID